jgi:NADPH:quinone reductase-like Zn-dependent oxidoreductase
MRAMVQREHGPPDVLHFEDLAEPVLRDTDVLLEVHATSVNPVDTKVRARAGAPREWPLVLGYDVCGCVVRCGSRVTQWKVGR